MNLMTTDVFAFIGGLNGWEPALIFFVILLLFGAKKIPQLARGFGKSIGEFKRAKEEFEDEIKSAETEAKTPKTAVKKPAASIDVADESDA